MTVPSREQVLDVVRDAIVLVLEIDPDTVSDGTRLVEDLQADSLALVEIVELTEGVLARLAPGFRIDDDDIESWDTVGAAVDYAVGRIR